MNARLGAAYKVAVLFLNWHLGLLIPSGMGWMRSGSLAASTAIGLFLLSGSAFGGVNTAPEETVPKITWPTQHGLIIDAGSTGSRMHVYEWDSRRFREIPPPFSYPLTSNRWTDRLAPGISAYADNPTGVGESLVPLLQFAKDTLKGKEHQFKHWPVFLKATGGMRQLPTVKREAIITEVRKFLGNKTLCPFYFEHDYARVISGEEEGIYGWTAINFALGKLLPASTGAGTVDANSSVGALDLGGASTQIAFFVPDQDILANMFKLQLGAQKHWNVYVHSFLYFGINSARDRLEQSLANQAVAAGKDTTKTNCLPHGFDETIREVGQKKVQIVGAKGNNFDDCLQEVIPLLHKDLNSWCDFAHNHQCSFAGVYQPDLPPPGPFGDFWGFGGFKDLWSFLEMPSDKANMTEFKKQAKKACKLNFKELKEFNRQKQPTKQESSTPLLAHYCFIATYAYALLTEGYHFEPDRNLTVVSKIDGLKVGWALGAMLYEINALPWEYVKTYTWLHAFVGSFLINILLSIGFIIFLVQAHRSALTIMKRQRSLNAGTPVYGTDGGIRFSPSEHSKLLGRGNSLGAVEAGRGMHEVSEERLLR